MDEDPISKESSGKRPRDWMDHTIRWGWIAIVVIIVIAVVNSAVIERTAVKPPEVSPARKAQQEAHQAALAAHRKAEAQKAKKAGEFLITQNCFCGRSMGDAARLYQAIAVGDSEAVTGLLDRGKALRIEKGTRVRTPGVSGSMAYIRILSGYQTGETCWIPENLLQ